MKKLILASALVAGFAVSAFAASFTVTIVDAATLAGITAARTAYCASLPPVVTTDKNGVTISTPAVCDLATDNAYFVQRMLEAAQSYAKQYDTAGDKKAAFLATLSSDKQKAVTDALK